MSSLIALVLVTGATGNVGRHVVERLRLLYRSASVPGYALHLRRQRLPWMQVLVQTVLHVGLRLGNAAHVDPALGQLLGRQPRALQENVADHLAPWRPGSS